MNLTDIVVEYGSVARAYRRLYNELDDRFGGYDVERFEEEVALLGASCTLLISGCNGDEVDNVEVDRRPYDGRDALVVYTPDHKFVLMTLEMASAVYSVVNIFPLRK